MRRGETIRNPKRVTGSPITGCSSPRPEGVVLERVLFPKARRRGTGAGALSQGPKAWYRGRQDYLLPVGRGERHNPKNQGTGQAWGYHGAGPGKNPSRKGNALLARGSAVRIPGGLWPSALFRGAAKTNGEGEVGRFAIRKDNREPQD
jgi:hypothetical protein